MIAVVPSAILLGATGQPVTVEVHVSSGLPGFTVVGLPDTAIRESRDRIRAALLSSGLPWPLRRVTVNLAPSSVRKGGCGLDLPIAVGLLVASGELAPIPAETAFIGELGLDGSLRHVPGMVALAGATRGEWLAVPAVDARDAEAVRPGSVRAIGSLGQLVDVVRERMPWPSVDRASGDGRLRTGTQVLGPDVPAGAAALRPHLDLEDVRGQRLGRRAIEVAAAGGHHLLLVGPPGSGKTMLAERLSGLLPKLTPEESLEVSRLHSAAGLSMGGEGLIEDSPFRAPHHSASVVSLVGGGTSSMRPGEISLADHGVLFLDEMGEFPVAVLDALRQPLEVGFVHISRAHATATYPAHFLLVGAMNPCPCGEGSAPGQCRCSDAERTRYARRVSAPLLDRFDLAVGLSRPHADEILGDAVGESTAAVRARVLAARSLAEERGVRTNASLSSASLCEHAPLSSAARDLFEHHLRHGALSARGLHRLRRVARTLADLDGGSAMIQEAHAAEAIALRAGRSALAIGASR